MKACLCSNRLHLRDLGYSRREFLARCGMGLGGLGLAGLLAEESAASAPSSAVGQEPPHFPSKARHVIHIFAQGAPSQVDTWDPKPALAQFEGRSLPELRGLAMPSPFQFRPSGKSGIEVSEVFSALSSHVDKMAVIRSMHTDIPAHDVATVFMNTGSVRMSRPSLGAWVLYGLGNANKNMPGYIALRPGGGSPPGGAANWGSAFLPGDYQATSINTANRTAAGLIPNLRNEFLSPEEQRRALDLVSALNRLPANRREHDARLEARIQSFEMAYRMQTEATDAFDVSKEPAAIRDLYGTSRQGRQLLIARRLVERGVRFVQVWAGGWDHHEDLAGRLPLAAREIDQPAAALLTDLEQRGLLEQTLVIWGGEFGRTVTRDQNENDSPGRDHNHRAFSVWLAGAGVKGGTVYGSTDEFGARAVENKVHVHDLHATILRLLGFNHERLTYRHNGRDFRLTDVYGKVVEGVLA